MQTRVSMWCSLTDMGWALPAREQLTKAEHIEEDRVRESLSEARKRPTSDLQSPCRVIRVLTGYKQV